MRKVFISVLFIVLILSACNSPKEDFSEIKNVPQKVDELIDTDLQLQLINDGTKGSYLIFHSKEEVEARLHSQGNIVQIVLDEINSQDHAVKQYVYYVKANPKHDTMNVLVNGEEVAFDMIIGL